VESQRGRFGVSQRITLLTPQQVRVDALKMDWVARYRTRELGVDTVRTLLEGYHAKHKEKEDQAHVKTANFLLQAGWTEEARKELEKIEKDSPDAKEAERVLESIRNAEAGAMVEALEVTRKAGQYQALHDMLTRFFKEDMGPRVTQKQLLQVQELKTKADALRERFRQAQQFLQTVAKSVTAPKGQELGKAAAVIAAEMHPDNVDRLETFLGQARAYDLAVKQGRPAPKPAEQVLALAVSGWVLGNDVAEESADAALALWQARQQVLGYQRTPADTDREKLRAGLQSEKLTPDVVARLIRLLPPPEPLPKMDNRPARLPAKRPGGGKATDYLVQLPPEYNSSRPYPLLLVLHPLSGKAPDALEKWSALAARYGFILAAPEWGQEGQDGYYYSAPEHAAVLNCLYDLRRHFQVDSDRVFLFGADTGGQMAYDVGLAHPDLFAGVLVMSAGPFFFAERYWPNAQHLPFYVVDGDKSGGSTQANRAIFNKHWVRRYPALYAEYRGRPRDWFADEPALMMDWMARKKRAFSASELGSDRDEYLTMREGDNRFYWLSTDSIQPRCLNNASAWERTVRPASVRAKVFQGNEVVVHTYGLKQVTVWLGPGMVNFGQKVTVQVNGSPGRPTLLRPSLETLLEDFFERGDRQQLFLAKVEVKL
jgi:pimeloyl-ACP methyl ester carboxylesterase